MELIMPLTVEAFGTVRFNTPGETFAADSEEEEATSETANTACHNQSRLDPDCFKL